ncbi:MAG TPA: polysaccharide deacetylase family protein [Bryobacteraceae bacterium]|nr:polysaccharide deacetylase family protein [Bryobacteraceae bacterium]
MSEDLFLIAEEFFAALQGRCIKAGRLGPDVCLELENGPVTGAGAVCDALTNAIRQVEEIHVGALRTNGASAGTWLHIRQRGSDPAVPLWVDVDVRSHLINRISVTPGWIEGNPEHSPTGVRIITYHRFHHENAVSRLRAQCELLVSEYEPMSITQAFEQDAKQSSITRKPIVVSVDDGHADFYSVAAPIFRSYGIPVVCFVVTGFLDGSWLWPDTVDYLIETSPCVEISIPLSFGSVGPLPLTNAVERHGSSQLLKEALKVIPNAERCQAIDYLRHAAQSPLPETPPQRFAPLTWNQVRELAATTAVTFGAHTVSHPILSRIETSDQIRFEVLGSKARMEEVLDMPIAHFAYPNGGPTDFDDRALESVQDAGFKTAVTTIPGTNTQGNAPFHLRRIWVEPSQSVNSFRARLNGCIPELEFHDSLSRDLTL